MAGAGYGDGNGPGTTLGLLCQARASLSQGRSFDCCCTGRADGDPAENSLGVRTRLAGGSGHSLRGMIEVKEPFRPHQKVPRPVVSFLRKALQPASPRAVALQSGSAPFPKTFRKIFSFSKVKRDSTTFGARCHQFATALLRGVGKGLPCPTRPAGRAGAMPEAQPETATPAKGLV